MKVAIIDNSSFERTILCSMMARYFTECSIQTEIIPFADGKSFIDSRTPEGYALIVINSMLTDISPKALAGEVLKNYPQALLLYLSDTEDNPYPEEGRLIHLVRPLSYEKIRAELISSPFNSAGVVNTITVMSDRLQLRLQYESIISIHVTNSVCSISLTDGSSIQTYMPLSEIAERLPSPPFLRCHRGYMVNMDYIDRPDRYFFRMKSGENVPISKKEFTRIRLAYFDYIFKKGGN